MRVSEDGQVVDFGYVGSGGPVLRFDVRSLTLSSPPPDDHLTSAPHREGLAIDGWRNGTSPTLGGRALPFVPYDIARSLAIAPDAKRFFLGSSFALAAFDDAGTRKWQWSSRNEIWAVNASKDGRVVVAADGDGAIRWHRADDGRELLALQVLPNKATRPMGLGAVDPRRLLRGDARRSGRAEVGDQSRPDSAATSSRFPQFQASTGRTHSSLCSRNSKPPGRSASQN